MHTEQNVPQFRIFSAPNCRVKSEGLVRSLRFTVELPRNGRTTKRANLTLDAQDESVVAGTVLQTGTEKQNLETETRRGEEKTQTGREETAARVLASIGDGKIIMFFWLHQRCG